LLVILCAFFLIISSFSYADVISYSSPHIWRLDTRGDYLLPRYSSNRTYECSETIEAVETIQTITANWKFSGQVTLGVSANNGVNYSSVINGVPFTVPSAVRGKQLKWKVILGDDSKVSEIKVSYTDDSGVIRSFGQPALSGFGFRKSIPINNPSEQDLFNYQARVLVAESKGVEDYDVECGSEVNINFNDLRFTAADGETLLPYHLESVSGQAPNRTASCWIKVPHIPSQGSVEIYLYYGNPRAEDLSSPEEVFDFFDAFDEEDIDADKWNTELLEDNGICRIVGSKLYLKNADVFSKEYKVEDGVMEYKVKVEEDPTGTASNEIWAILRGEKGDAFLETYNQLVFSSVYPGAEHCIAIGDIVKVNESKPAVSGSSYDFRVLMEETSLTAQRYVDGFSELEAEVSYDDQGGLTTGSIGFKTGGDGIYFDWVRVRKYSSPDVRVDREAVGKEEKVSLPRFEDIEISQDGDLVLNNETVDGGYTSEVLSLAYKGRIFIPKWEGEFLDEENIKLDISLDGGDTYVENCKRDKFYYASKGEFEEGDDLKFKFKLEFLSFSRSKAPRIERIKIDYRPGVVAIVYPNGGEMLEPGKEKEVMWSALEYEEAYPIKLEYSLDKGKTYEVIEEETANDGSYFWKVPSVETAKALIRVCDGYNHEVCDTSDDPFIIMASEEITPQIEEVNWDSIKWGEEGAPGINTDVVIDKDINVSAEGEIAFKTLTIGDGVGEKKSILVLKGKINPNSGQIIIRKGGELIQGNKDLQKIEGDLIIEDGGILTHRANTDTQEYQINISAQKVTLKEGGTITARGRGFPGGDVRQGGKGKSAGKYFLHTASGGSHAGRGGGTKRQTLDKDDAKNLVYGLSKSPQEIGSGGAGSWFISGGAGGGVIRLDARGFFDISGVICVDGKDGGVSPDNQFDGGGGAGGSIYLSAGEFGGRGAEVTATGGSGHITGGGGGGGRIYLKAPAGGVRGTMNVNGGDGFEKGKGGSLILE
jgi:hypothetical protein